MDKFSQAYSEMKKAFSNLFISSPNEKPLNRPDNLLRVKNSVDELIDSATADNVEWLSFENQNLRCKCVDVYDGDTITLALPFGGSVYKMKCRLEGIDCAEIKTKNLTEKKLGYLGRDFLRSKILNSVVWVRCGKGDKFGRLLITIYQTEEDMNEEINDLNRLLVDSGYAYPYGGATKNGFSDWHTSEVQVKHGHDLNRITLKELKEKGNNYFLDKEGTLRRRDSSSSSDF